MKKPLLVLSLLTLTSCNAVVSNSSISSENPASSQLFSSYESSLSSDNTSESKSSSSSKRGQGMSIVTSKESSKSSHTYSVSEDPNAIYENEVMNLFAEAYQNDKNISDVDLVTYNINKNDYIKEEYTSKLYTNNILYNIGKMTYKKFLNDEKIEQPFKEQIMYKDGVFTSIKKYNSAFINTATRKEGSFEEFSNKFSLTQIVKAYAVYEEFSKQEYHFLDAKKLENGGHYISMEYFEEIDNDGYCMAGGIELTLDKDNYLIDLFYSEGVYDYMYLDSVSLMRKHGPAPYGNGGIIYEATNIKYNRKEEYKDPLVFPLEENFIKSISFKSNEITISKSENYIDLYNYVVTDPFGGETEGCPYNNLEFTSSNSSIASVDGHYLDFKKTGNVEISVKDKATNARSTTSLKVIIE